MKRAVDCLVRTSELFDVSYASYVLLYATEADKIIFLNVHEKGESFYWPQSLLSNV